MSPISTFVVAEAVVEAGVLTAAGGAEVAAAVDAAEAETLAALLLRAPTTKITASETATTCQA
jgi:hypothetical protein